MAVACIFALRFGGGIKFLNKNNGGLAQLARALAWHVRGHRFDPDTLHNLILHLQDFFCLFLKVCFFLLVRAFWKHSGKSSRSISGYSTKIKSCFGKIFLMYLFMFHILLLINSPVLYRQHIKFEDRILRQNISDNKSIK